MHILLVMGAHFPKIGANLPKIGANLPKMDAHLPKMGAHLPKIDDYFFNLLHVGHFNLASVLGSDGYDALSYGLVSYSVLTLSS